MAQADRAAQRAYRTAHAAEIKAQRAAKWAKDREQRKPEVLAAWLATPCYKCGRAIDPPETIPQHLQGRRQCEPCKKAAHAAAAQVRRAQHPEQIRAQARASRTRRLAEDPETFRATQRAAGARWRATNRFGTVAMSANKAARKYGAVGRVTGEELQRQFENQRGHCYYDVCHRQLDLAAPKWQDNQATIDHLTPLPRGGGGSIDNLRWACWRCNHRKSTQTDPEYMLARGMPYGGDLLDPEE